MFEAAKAWIKARWAERSSWDGLTIIGISVALYLAHMIISPLVPWIALGGAGYGIYRLVQAES